MSSQFIIQGIGCILTMLLVLSVQAINYEVHRYDVTPTKLNSNIILTNRDLLEQLNHVAPKASYTLQESTERLLYFGALLRARILDTFGNLLYIYYDDFSVKEVEALYKVYQEMFERRYDIFNLVPVILKNPNTRPSKICAGIYVYAEPCLKRSANICRRIKKHNFPHPDDLSMPALNVTHLAYRFSRISRQYLRGFSLAAILKLLQRKVLRITPDLLSGLLYNVRYDNFDDDVRLAERELVQSFRKIAQITKIPIPLPELKKFRTVNSFLKYYVNIYAEKVPDNNLKRHASLIKKRIIDDVGTINENIYLLGNVYENQTIHIKYLFDLVLPDDLLDNDVIEAKRYLVKKLNEFNMVEKYLKVQKYQQATPAHLAMEITGQLKDIDFAKSIAISLRIHARFWRSNHMIESLDELLELFDAYENLRQVPYYNDMMQKIDSIKENLWDMKDIPVEILCNTPRACLQIGLRSILHCKYMNSEIKELIKDFFKLSNMCVVPVYAIQETSRRTVDIPFKISKIHFLTQLTNVSTIEKPKMQRKKKLTTTSETTIQPSIVEDYVKSKSMESSESEETTESSEISKESTESAEISTKPKTSSDESTNFMNKATTIMLRTIEHTEPISTTMIINDRASIIQEETTTTKSTTTMTTTVSPMTTTLSPTTTTILPTTTTLSPTTTTLSPTTITVSPTTITLSPTTTTLSPTTTTLSSTTTTLSPTTTTVLTTTLPTTLSTTLTTTSPTTTTSPITTILPTTTTLATTTTTSPVTTISTETITKLPILDIKMTFEHSNINNLYNDEITQSSTSVTTSASRSCESDECSTEQSSEETNEKTTTQTSTLETIQITSEPSITNQDFAITETTVTSTTELSETLVTKGCRSKSESIELSRTFCETSCDSDADCDGEDSVLKDISEKVKNHTAKCSKHLHCKENSPEISSKCETETDKSCECISKEEKSAECMTSCSSDENSSSCEGSQNDCSRSEVPTVNMKLELAKKRGMCEIQDPHHRRQMKRLAKMRAISTLVATSNADVFRSKVLRHRTASKKLYNLLAAKLSHIKDERSRSRIAEYLLKRPLRLKRIEGNNRKQQEQVYRLRRLATKLNGKLIERTMHRSMNIPFQQSQIKRISSRNVKSINATMHKKVIQG
ncbi:uncharacterized protein [Anoplolepis gracilipes]|uniref:uncharacterized protein isoform X2 n=1 Tax=Anoplolepis gracilipes TaxID=354296 RepID=UPI003B9E4024